jgi:hypothetical protein
MATRRTRTAGATKTRSRSRRPPSNDVLVENPQQLSVQPPQDLAVAEELARLEAGWDELLS